ncbi:VOC family protein [Erythrobacter litoralis]|uniref:VOC family protein n=1 Tax=Erythrobacter litoralis TaxID=39960 RepID=UPI002435FA44|nr:VOC family protein [Erythrobacter litoralis]MDG6080250.1 VOC family protein [Erythrobacter litoralis]
MTHSLSRGIEHIGMTVPNHETAVRFFGDALGAEILFSLVTKSDESMGAEELGPKNGLAAGTAIVAVTMMRLRNGPNLEIFEIDYPKGQPVRGIAEFGLHHISLTVDDMEAVTKRFEDAGGTLLEGPYDLTGQEAGEGNRGRFGRTPWGLLIEFESFGSPIEYDAEARARRWFPDEG